MNPVIIIALFIVVCPSYLLEASDVHSSSQVLWYVMGGIIIVLGSYKALTSFGISGLIRNIFILGFAVSFASLLFIVWFTPELTRFETSETIKFIDNPPSVYTTSKNEVNPNNAIQYSDIMQVDETTDLDEGFAIEYHLGDGIEKWVQVYADTKQVPDSFETMDPPKKCCCCENIIEQTGMYGIKISKNVPFQVIQLSEHPICWDCSEKVIAMIEKQTNSSIDISKILASVM